jgi:hypothetical protein|tara:strand:- start:121 stop:441 length:321 start_codon:yes stop_codon:yes gene_type:complete
MAIDIQLTNFFPHTVTINPYASYNNFGEETFSGSTRTAKAYVEPNNTLRSTDMVKEETRPTRAIVSDTSLTVRDKITLPDDTTPEIAYIEKHTEVVGLEHTVVTFK